MGANALAAYAAYFNVEPLGEAEDRRAALIACHAWNPHVKREHQKQVDDLLPKRKGRVPRAQTLAEQMAILESLSRGNRRNPPRKP